MLHEVLMRIWREGCRYWPQVDLPSEIFVGHMTELLNKDGKGDPLAAMPKQWDAQGLFLACACLHQRPGAIAALEKHYLARLPAVLRARGLSPMEQDDVCQEVRRHLLMGTPESGPKLAGFMGRGSLRSWIRVMAMRMVTTPKGVAHEPLEVSALEALRAPEVDMERELDVHIHGSKFRQALGEVLSGLSKRDRAVMLWHIRQLPEREIAALFGVDQATISRWLKKAKETSYRQTKQRIQERMGLTSRQFKSFTNALKSYFDMSISQFLADDEQEKDPD